MSAGCSLRFEQDDAAQRIRGTFRLGAEYQGGAGFIHGGIIATVLDEAMGKVCRFRGRARRDRRVDHRIFEAGARGCGFGRRRLREWK